MTEQSVNFRPYQIDAINLMRTSFKAGTRSLLLVLPTGAGKTTVASDMIQRGLQNGKRSLFLAHRTELVEQAAARLANFGVYAGIEQAGKRARNARVTVASIPTLVRRSPDTFPDAQLVIVDEAHHSTSAGFAKLIRHYTARGAFIVGLTATPYRMDNKPLGDLYSDLIAPISMAELINQGHLVPPVYYAVDHRDLYSSVKLLGGDYNTKQAFEIANKPKLYGEVVDKYSRHADKSKPTIVFNINVEHSQATVDAFLSAGIKAKHVDGETPQLEREAILADFKAGRFPVLCNVMILTEGYDLPQIGTVIINRATKSKSLWKQMVGRGLRPCQDKTKCIVIDHGGNVWEHGFVEGDEAYDLFPEQKAKSGVKSNPPVKLCPACDSILHLSSRYCDCGYSFPESEIRVDERAELVLIENLQARSESNTEPTTTPTPKDKRKTLPLHLRKKYADMNDTELHEFAQHMGYKVGWVYHQRRLRNSPVLDALARKYG